MALESFAALGVASSIVQFVDFGCRIFSQSRKLYKSSNGQADEGVELENITRSLGRLSSDLVAEYAFGDQPPLPLGGRRAGNRKPIFGGGSASSDDSDLELEDVLPIEPANTIGNYREEVDLMQIAQDCKRMADELLDALDQLKVRGPGKKWQCFRVTLKRVWKPEKIDEMARRVERFSNQLTICLVKILKYRRHTPIHQGPTDQMLRSTKQSAVLSSLRILSQTSERLISTTNSNFESMRRTTLNILEKLEEAHKLNTSSLQGSKDRDYVMCLQLKQLSSKLKVLKEMGERSATEHRILESLHYQRMEVRQEKIIDAHAQTFDWIFDPHISSNELHSKDNFLEWLHNGNDIFWITGKAGSGKSTLTKFVSHHKSSISALQRWADGKELITAEFYFWHAGTELQKSQEGLLQSLLFGILSKCPEIMPQVLSERWEQCTRTHITSCRWTRAELLNAFAVLSLQNTLGKRFCFFIDGLDEYNGNHSEVVDLVQSLAQSKDIKLCLSSRPWNVFTRAFGWGSHPKIHLEDLTRGDIKSYVQDTLGSSELFCQLKAGKDSARCEKLQEEIVSRAQGVFLWVFLVVRSLILGLTNADRVTDLERRLQSLPTDLEACFRHMLETIEEVYRQQTVQTFHIALQAAEPLSLMTYAMIDELEENPEYAIELPIQQMTTTDLDSRCQDMKLRINARCKDLLQVTRKKSYKVRDANSMNPMYLSKSESLPLSEPQPFSENLPLEPNYLNGYLQSDYLPPYAEPTLLVDAPAPENTHCSQIPNGEVSLHPLFQYEVDFLHRTVKDFFQVNDIQSFIASRVPETFNHCSLLCHAFLAQIKVASVEMHHFDQVGELSDLIDDMVHYAHEAETRTAHSSIVLLDELSNAVQVHRDSFRERGVGGSMTDFAMQDPSMRRFCQSFLGFAVQRDLQLYVKYKLEERLRHAPFEWEHDELVLDALQPSVTSKYGVHSTNKTMLRVLVDKGVDLNRSFGQRNVWDHIVGLICQQWAYWTETTRIHQLENITALLEVGAEPNWSPGPDRLRWVQFILIPSTNWRSRSSEFKAALTKTIVTFCERGIDPYWEFEGYTLWIHLIRSIYDEGHILGPLSLETKGFVLVVIKKFMDLGAQLDDMINHDVIKHEDGVPVRLESMSVTDVLTGVFKKTEMEELEHLQRRAGPESSDVKPSRSQRRREKRKRKERKRDVGTGW